MIPITLRCAVVAASLSFATLTHATGLGSNLVVNGNAESGLSGWTAYDSVSTFSAVEYGSNWVLPEQPGPVDRGTFLFVGGSGVSYGAAHQVLDTSGLGAGVLGGGAINYTLSGYLGGWLAQEDATTLTLRFMDSANLVVGSATLGPVTPTMRGSETGLFFFQTAGAVPVGTTSLDLIMEMTRVSGGDNDGYADNLSVVLTAVPEPTSAALLLAGVAALGLRARRARVAR